MLYRDGFFHADLHPGNLIVLPGPKAGFIDLGMVGRFDEELKRTMLYYYYCMVTGDAENAARYLGALAETGAKSNPKGFQREVEETRRRCTAPPTSRFSSASSSSVAAARHVRMFSRRDGVDGKPSSP